MTVHHELDAVLHEATEKAEHGDAAGVLEALARAPTEAMVHPAFWWLRGHALLWQDELQEAGEAFETLLELRPEDDEARALAASAFARLLRFGKAEALLLEGLARRPRSVQLLEAYCHTCAMATQTEKAQALLDALLEVEPRSERAYSLRVLIEFMRGDRGALRDARIVQLAGEPDSFQKSLQMGEALLESGHVTRAGEWFARALEQEPRLADEVPEFEQELRVLRSPWLLPNRVFDRFGRWLPWIVCVALYAVLRLIHETTAIAFLAAFILFTLYSWMAPAVVRRLIRSREGSAER